MIHNDDDKPEQEEKAAEEENFASVETDRYAPQLEPEQPAESGIRRDAVMTKPEAMKQAGIAYATEQIIDLIANHVNGIHVYSMNKPDVARQIKNNLSEIL